MATSERSDGFDENKATAMMDLYSRQIGSFGVQTMQNLAALHVLVVGVKGVGVELAKNIILTGPRSVTICDESPIRMSDLGTNFFFSAEEVGKRSSQACIEQLGLLNPYVAVSEHVGEITEEVLSRFGVVCITADYPLNTLIRWNNFCRSHVPAIPFILGLSNGVTACLFSDFGPSHLITDVDGEPALVNVVEDVEVVSSEDDPSKRQVVVKVAAVTHNLEEDALVSIDDVEGMEALNKKQARVGRIYCKYDGGKRQRLVANQFVLKVDEDLISSLGVYRRGGIITEVKSNVTFKFRSLEEALVNPLHENEFFMLHPNTEKQFAFQAEQLHFARIAIWKFQETSGSFPRLHDASDAARCVELAQEVLEAHRKMQEGTAVVVEKLDESVVRNTALYYASEVSGLCTFVGGVAAQEIVKKFGKYTPLHQWLHLDFFETLGEKVPQDGAPLNSRYDHQIAIFGKSMQDLIGRQKWFMVGCGALGCEYLKGFALMGLGAGGGNLHVTDMDRIEVSNLSRQFLFRMENVGQQKSLCAASAAKKMNPQMNITCFETKVGPDTENVFHDDFWTSLDGVCNALDNVIARRYVDSRCVFYEKPLLESGTLGTKANSEIVIPHLTASYSEGQDDVQTQAIPMCTLRNFPHLIDHCIEWARAQFTEVFEIPFKDILSLMKDREEFLKKVEREGNVVAQLEKLRVVRENIAGCLKPTYASCLQMAVDYFYKQFTARIRDLIADLPENFEKEDPITKKMVPFWSGTKRFPQFALLDPKSNEQHLELLFSVTNLYAYAFKVPPVKDKKVFVEIMTQANPKVLEWKPPVARKTSNLYEEEGSSTTEAQEGTASAPVQDEAMEEMLSLKKELQTMDLSLFVKPQPSDFEKDDDTNFHIDFITSCANMRAWNYHIPVASRHHCKMIAGHIIPALATTTAMITGLVSMELYKILLCLKKSMFLGSNVNLGTSTFSMFEPPVPGRAKPEYDYMELDDLIPVPDGFTVWDKIVVDRGNLTVAEFLDVFPKVHHNLNCTYLCKKTEGKGGSGDASDIPLYSEFHATPQLGQIITANMSRKLVDVYEEVYGKLVPGKKYVLLAGSFTTEDDRPAKVPLIKYVFAK